MPRAVTAPTTETQLLPQPPEPTDILAPPAEPLATPAPPARPSIVSRLIYLALFVLPVLLVLIVGLARAGVLSTAPHEGKTPWMLATMLLGTGVVLIVGGLVAQRAPDLVERSRNESAIDHERSRWELRILIASLGPALGLLALAYLAWAGVVTHVAGATLSPIAPSLLAAAAALVTCGPVGYFSYARERQIQQLEDRFPDFLRDLNESYGAGLTMAQAIRVAARGDYGRLNPEIRRMAHQVSWGTPFPEALKMFADRVGTPIVTRAVALIIKATRAGGNAKDVLAAAARDSREIKALQNERKLSMTLYVIVIYVAFGVFLGVVAALQGLLVPALLKSTGASIPGQGIGSVVAAGGVTLTDYRLIYLGIGVVQALGSGIVAGVMAEGSYAAGLKHSTILIALAIGVLGILL
jgi:flagellar protein FlaJ